MHCWAVSARTSQSEPVSVLGPEIGSLFLFEVPNPENVEESSAPPAEEGSRMKAHSFAPSHTEGSSQSATPSLFESILTTFVPDGAPDVTPKRSAQSGPLAVFPSPTMFAAVVAS